MTVVNRQKLYGTAGAGLWHLYKMRLVYSTILEPLGRFYRIRITSGGRTLAQQAKQLKSKRTKKTSQHTLWEAADFVTEPLADLEAAFEHIYKYLGYHQLIIYFEDDVAKHVHVSLRSQSEGIRRKVLVNTDGRWSRYGGETL